MTASTTATRAAELCDAYNQALALLARVEASGIIQPGRTEKQVGEGILALAKSDFGIERRWHRELVRSGPNTSLTFADGSTDRTLESEDMVTIDLGPVFADWEADIGRTYYLGQDPDGHKLVQDLPRIFDTLRSSLLANPDQTGAELYAEALSVFEDFGWSFIGKIAGHIVGEFAHFRWAGRDAKHYVRADNHTKLSEPDDLGRKREWIIEVHIADPRGRFAGFYEQLVF